MDTYLSVVVGSHPHQKFLHTDEVMNNGLMGQQMVNWAEQLVDLGQQLDCLGQQLVHVRLGQQFVHFGQQLVQG